MRRRSVAARPKNTPTSSLPETGYFASNIRGEVVGRERLIALVRSERHCIEPPRRQAAAGPRPVPMVTIESNAKGVTGRAELGAAGYYADEYVKTPKGWRIKARTVITGQEQKANLSVEDVTVIRRLAGTDLGLFDDVYVAGRRRREALQNIRRGAWPVGRGSDRTRASQERRRSLRGRVRPDRAGRLALQVAGVCGGRCGSSRQYTTRAALTRCLSTGPAPGKLSARDGNL